MRFMLSSSSLILISYSLLCTLLTFLFFFLSLIQVVFNHETPEDPCVSSGYLARFKDLEIRVVTLDAILQVR